ncbi:MAG: toll/interleukin-1 receptor domain-containing protein [Flavobacteriales bacterium]|nr:MAG: toll/interleukin-1 receptor domain-containing protein [Flavobacteriales bacterium]
MDITLEVIVDEINEGNCLVILGPHLLGKDGTNINIELNAYLKERLGDQVNFYTDDGFLSFDPDDRDMYIGRAIKKFYEKLEPNEVYRQIAEIPFSMVINTAPDKTLNKAYDEKNRAYDYDYFKMYEAPKDPPTEHSTLIYNIFGDYEDTDSMVLTFKDLSKYLYSIMNSEPKIKSTLNEAKAVLFFGFSFDKWYFQLLLSLMRLEKKVKNSWEIPKDNIKNFFLEEFKFKFFDNNTAEEIIQQLYQATQAGTIKAPKKENIEIELYISYAWKGESEEMADLLEKVLEKNQIHLIRDKNDLEYKERITEFMKRIGKANGVVVVISDKYLKSRYCMFELMEIYEKNNFEARIFPIVLGDAKIFEVEGILGYKEYWKAKMDDLNAKMVGADAAKTLGPEYEQCERIHGYMDKVGDTLKDMNSLTPEIHRDTNFEELIKAIKKQF